MLTGLIAQVLASKIGSAPAIFARIDDTNAKRSEGVSVSSLLREIREVALVPITPAVGLEGGNGALYQSKRAARYARALGQLDSLGLVRREGKVVLLSMQAIDTYLMARSVDPGQLISSALTNVTSAPVDHPQDLVPLTRADGSALWHIASVVDDVDLDVTLIVRGTDKISATGVQERIRWVLSDGQQAVAYVFVPRLLEVDRDGSRVASILGNGIRAASLRWYLVEPFAETSDGLLPTTFADLADGLARRRTIPLRDAAMDLVKLGALDRKISSQLTPDAAQSDLVAKVGSERLPIVEMISREWARTLPEQVRLYESITSVVVRFDKPPSDAAISIDWLRAYMNGQPQGSAPFGVRWVLTGRSSGPHPSAILDVFPRSLLESRLGAAMALVQ